MIWSCGGALLSTMFLIAALSGLLHSSVALVAVMVFVAVFGIGLGPIPWLIVAEMFDAKYVETAMSISCIVNWSCNFVAGTLISSHAKYTYIEL